MTSLRSALYVLILALVPGAASAVDHNIDLWFLGMTPVVIEAGPGDTVRWTAVGPGHNVFQNLGLTDQDLDVNVASEICSDNTNTVQIDAAGTAEFNASTAGTYYFYCDIVFPLHCNNGMRVRVNVTDSTPVPEGENPQPWGSVKVMYR